MLDQQLLAMFLTISSLVTVVYTGTFFKICIQKGGTDMSYMT